MSARTKKSVFFDALDIKCLEDRCAYVSRACEGDQELLASVQALLREHDRESNPVDEPIAKASFSDEIPGYEPSPGATVGPYKLMEKIGEGGFGLVYVAEQLEPVRRRIALKIIKPGMESREVIARFEAERQALAMMDHENIARVLDAGVTEIGNPFFVMELVRGVPLIEFCDNHRLKPRARLELFVSICNALQ
ncbi:MAG: protein kinase, partial [Planctomycetota bacterium]